MAKERKNLRFELRFGARRVRPEQISFAALRRAIEALQQLLSGPDEDEPDQRVQLALVRIKRGSAVFCLSAEPARGCMAHLRRLREAVREGRLDDETAYAADALRCLSALAQRYACPVTLTTDDGRRQEWLRVEAETYERMAQAAFTRGELTTVAFLVRVGGATAYKCALRLSGRRRVLFCPVESRELARKMAAHLYGWIVVSGPGAWVRQTRRIVELTVRDFRPVASGNLLDRCRRVREASGGVWDEIADPQQYLLEHAGE